MNAEFNWWLLIVGLVIGAGLVWLILSDSARREVDVTRRERAAEARWIAAELRRAGHSIADDEVADVLDLHAGYLEAPPPDDPDGIAEPAPADAPAEPAPSVAEQAPDTLDWPGERMLSDGRDHPSPSRTG